MRSTIHLYRVVDECSQKSDMQLIDVFFAGVLWYKESSANVRNDNIVTRVDIETSKSTHVKNT